MKKELLESKKVIKIYYNQKSNYQKVDYKCEICGAVREKIIFKANLEDRRGCRLCKLYSLTPSTSQKILTLFTRTYEIYLNYISTRLMFSDKLTIRQMIEEFLSKNNNLELLKDETNTIGLNNPFVDTVWIENLVIKKIEEDKIDRNRYSNNISKYENVSTGRTTFKNILKSQNLNFNDFTEVFNGEYVYYMREGGEARNKKYNYYFKKGTIEDYYYKK